MASVASPPASVTEPRIVAPSTNVTVPVGPPDPPPEPLTLAVNVTACPNREGFAEEESSVFDLDPPNRLDHDCRFAALGVRRAAIGRADRHFARSAKRDVVKLALPS